MSLDVWLTRGTRECIHCFGTGKERTEVFSANITHNLNRMAEAAGIYEHLWRPEELGIKYAKDLVAPIREGLEKMKADPEKFKKFDSPNGWGLYENFVPWIERYLEACKANPDAEVWVSR